ncbi:murein biosynthesis integral membrane protein MurJ [uncultured Ornithinimicrobium sp.]|uniref:murein biosynthesis integral membrane protein MurJ n=1 Tax=uncultured Ornithinimicrobium sp. TaxID=259307 RepID=UPI002598FA34|nr:murein biosynthesis integral membrane protein MurJ [uncultured Ornithinimicrobium sp.]
MSGTSSASLARSSAVMASGTLVSRVLGLARASLLAAAIGIFTPAGNVWQAANTLPNTIYVLLAAGVLNVVLLPQLMKGMVRGDAGRDYTDRLLTLAVSILVGGTVVFVALTPLVTKLYNMSWEWGGPELSLAIFFAYLCIPQMLFYGLHTLLGQVLAAHQRFAAFMWSPALANVVAIAGIVLFMRRYPQAADPEAVPLETWTSGMVWLLAGSATLGIVVQAAVLVPAVRRTGFRWSPRWGFRGVGLGSASRMAGWSLADVGVSQAGLLVVYNLMAWVTVAAPTAPARAAYDNSFLVFILPHSLVALSLLTAIYPVLSRAAAQGDLASMADSTARGLRLLGTAMVPIAVGMILFAPHLIRIIFPRNADPTAMAPIVMVLSLGLVPYGVYLLCARVFYSFEDGRTPFGFQLAITTVLLVVLAVAFTGPPERAAVTAAAGQALGQLTAAVLGLRAARSRLPGLGLREVARTFLGAAGAAVLAAVPTWLLLRRLPSGSLDSQSVGLTGWAVTAVSLGAAGVLFLTVYAVLAHLLGVRELGEVARPVLAKVPGASRWLGRGRPEGAVAAQQATPDVPAAPGTAAPGTLGWDDDVAPSGVEHRKDSDMDRLEVGTVLGDRYALEELLARREGGTLDYWSARDVTLGRLVAVTVLPAGGGHADTAQAALDGARRVASVDDPRLVRVLDVGSGDGLAWIVEEGLSEAESLASLVAEAPLPAEEARRIVGEAAAGLESARRRGLHHLYLNPHSVLRTSDGTVKVSGVGVASALEGTDDVTADEASIIDTADLVSLLYTGLTARWPGEEMPGVSLARRLADGSLPAPSELVGGVPGDLDALCRLVLGSGADLGRAPHTPGELARQLSPWASEMVHARRPPSLGAPSSGTGGDPSAGPLTGAAGATAAAAAAHPADTEHLRSAGADATGPRPYYRVDDGDGMDDLLDAGADRTGPTPVQAGTDPSGEPDRDRPSTAEMLGIRSTGERPGRGSSSPGRRPVDDGPRGLEEERSTGAQTAVVALVLVGLVGLAAVLGWSAIQGMGQDDPDDPAAPVATAPEDAAGATGDGADGTASTGAGEDTDDTATQTAEGEDEEGGEAAPAPAPGDDGTLPVLGITSFDPEGDGDERNDLTPLAVDGDPETAWTSHTYLSPGWGSLKSGTGLVLDLGEDAEVSEVVVDLAEGDMGATLYLADEPTIDGATELGSDDEASGTWTVTPEDTATGRYLVLWFDRAWTSPDGEIVGVREITVG